MAHLTSRTGFQDLEMLPLGSVQGADLGLLSPGTWLQGLLLAWENLPETAQQASPCPASSSPLTGADLWGGRGASQSPRGPSQASPLIQCSCICCA